jgi:hypothetical protein
MFLVMRDVGDGEILIGVIREEKQLTDTVISDIAKRFPRDEENADERVDFLKEAYRKYASQYKLVAAS